MVAQSNWLRSWPLEASSAAGNTRWIGQDRRINVAESAMSILSRIGKGSFAEKEQKNEILIMRGLIYNLSMNIINNYRCSSPIRLLLWLWVIIANHFFAQLANTQKPIEEITLINHHWTCIMASHNINCSFVVLRCSSAEPLETLTSMYGRTVLKIEKYIPNNRPFPCLMNK